MRRVLASFTLLALAACSSAGVCWAEVARLGHDCCESAETMEPAKACASTVESVARVVPAPPSDSVALAPAPIAAPHACAATAHVPEVHGPRPPLVLRI